jgi:hypothetical protein
MVQITQLSLVKHPSPLVNALVGRCLALPLDKCLRLVAEILWTLLL